MSAPASRPMRQGGLLGVVLTLGVLVLASACGSPTDSVAAEADASTLPASASSPASASASSGASATPSAAPTESPPDSTGDIGGPWATVLDAGEAGRVNRLYDMTQLGSRLIAVGESVHTTVIHVGPYERDGMIWISDDDGDTWRPADATPSLSGATLSRVVTVDDEAFAFGHGAGVLRSSDGASWETAQLPGFAADNWTVYDIAGGPQGWVMIGERLATGLSRSELQIWFSSDWQTWELARRMPGQESYRDVSAGPEGFVVSGDLLGLGDAMALMLASGDGRTWEVAPEQPSLAHGLSPLWVAPIAGDWVAVGSNFSAAGSPVWKSANGLSWQIVATVEDPQARPEFGWGRHVASANDRLFMSTWLTGLMAELEAGVWTSLDGTEWELLELSPGASVSSALRVGDRWVLAGHVGGAESNATIWTSAGP